MLISWTKYGVTPLWSLLCLLNHSFPNDSIQNITYIIIIIYIITPNRVCIPHIIQLTALVNLLALLRTDISDENIRYLWNNVIIPYNIQANNKVATVHLQNRRLYVMIYILCHGHICQGQSHISTHHQACALDKTSLWQIYGRNPG